MGYPLKRWFGLFALVAGLVLGSAGAVAQMALPQVHAELVAQSRSPVPGSDVPVAIVLDPGLGWHIYWQNPGDSGYPPRFGWRLPAGASISAPEHPAPTRLTIGGIAMNVHLGRAVLLERLHVPAGLPAGARLPLAGSVDLLVCSDEACVPQMVPLATTLTIGAGEPDAAAAALIAGARRAMPVPLAGEASLRIEGKLAHLRLPLPPLGAGESLTLFPTGTEGGVPGMARVERGEGDGLALAVPLGSASPAALRDLVVTKTRADGLAVGAWRVRAQQEAVAAQPGQGGLLAVALAGAVLGGLLLNLMPCVFPILSLKAMALVRSGGGAGEARAEAGGYLLGAVGTMMALGAIVLALRAGGEAIGWAFQLQNPAVVAVLLLLVVAIAVNLAGLFELPGLGFVSERHGGFMGGIGTGALAAFVATPCTGPFMAGALGAALVLPAAGAMAVFAGLGFGLALPFLLIGFWEPARRLMPKPGHWMVTLRHVLSLPMFATALGLVWLIGQQAGVGAMTVALGGAQLLGLALWWAGMRQRLGLGIWPAMPGVALAVALAAVGVGVLHVAPAVADAAPDVVPYSAARLESLRARHQPVLLFATAAWCLTCKVNEASSLSPERVRTDFRRHGAVMMEADWTRNDPEVTRLLTKNGRAGVPLYLWYPASGRVRILPQVLTPDLVKGLVGA